MDDDSKQAVKILNDGGIVIFPTDTAFGIGCRIDKPDSIDRLFRIRRRPLQQATPVLVSSETMALAYFDHPSEIVRHLMKTYWPGALTIIAECKQELVYSPVRGGGKTIGLREPDHKKLLEIINAVGVPILGPSANFHGFPTSFRYEDLDTELVKLVDYTVPGRCSVGNVSTVVDCSVDPYILVRQGAIHLP